jgi:hypothetical protein
MALGVPPDAVKPLVSTHLERMSLTRLLGSGARINCDW